MKVTYTKLGIAIVAAIALGLGIFFAVDSSGSTGKSPTTARPTTIPTVSPTNSPTNSPTVSPTGSPSQSPSANPTIITHENTITCNSVYSYHQQTHGTTRLALSLAETTGITLKLNQYSDSCLTMLDSSGDALPLCTLDLPQNCFLTDTVGSCQTSMRLRLPSGNYTILMNRRNSAGVQELNLQCGNFWEEIYDVGTEDVRQTGTGINVLDSGGSPEMHYILTVPESSRYTPIICGNVLVNNTYTGDYFQPHHLCSSTIVSSIVFAPGNYTFIITANPPAMSVEYNISFGGPAPSSCTLQQRACLSDLGSARCLYCDIQGAPHFLTATAPGYHVLDLSDFNIGYVGAAFANMTWVRELDLSDNVITGIAYKAFEGLQLTKIDLAGNELLTLFNVYPFGASSQSQLSYIDLSNNNLTGNTILGDLDIATWETMKLAHNRLDGVNDLNVLTKLTNLDISFNFLTSLPNLEDLDKLLSLNVSHNLIDNITDLGNLDKLTSLNVSHNYVSSLPNLNGLTNLTSLDVSHNYVSSLSNQNGLTKLTKLFLSHNALTTLHSSWRDPSNQCPESLDANGVCPFAARHLATALSPTLVHLDISNNNFAGQMFDFANMSNIDYLNMSGNNFVEVKADQMTSMGTSLITFDLTNNLLFKVNMRAFDSLSILDNLYLSGNPMVLRWNANEGLRGNPTCCNQSTARGERFCLNSVESAYSWLDLTSICDLEDCAGPHNCTINNDSEFFSCDALYMTRLIDEMP